MAFSRKHLTAGEHVELELRTHIKTVLGPLVLLVLLILIMIAGLIWIPDGSARPWLLLALGIVLLVVAVIAVLIPVLRWRTNIYVVTNRRMITRTGILAKSGRDIPLYRINDVSYEKGVFDRILGCGTLFISDASEQAPLQLHDVPHVEEVQVRLNELLFAHESDEEAPIPPARRTAYGDDEPDFDNDPRE